MELVLQNLTFNIVFLFYFQLHNMTLAFDLLRDTGLEVTSVNPQGERVTHFHLHDDGG